MLFCQQLSIRNAAAEAIFYFAEERGETLTQSSPRLSTVTVVECAPMMRNNIGTEICCWMLCQRTAHQSQQRF